MASGCLDRVVTDGEDDRDRRRRTLEPRDDAVGDGIGHVRKDDRGSSASVQDRVAKRPRIAAYLASERRFPCNEQGIFRHYRELDA